MIVNTDATDIFGAVVLAVAVAIVLIAALVQRLQKERTK